MGKKKEALAAAQEAFKEVWRNNGASKNWPIHPDTAIPKFKDMGAGKRQFSEAIEQKLGIKFKGPYFNACVNVGDAAMLATLFMKKSKA